MPDTDSRPDNDEKPTRPPRRLLWVLPAIVVVFLVVLAAIPYGMSWALQDWLLKNGASRVEIRDIDFNPFLGLVNVELLSAYVGDSDTLHIPRLTLEVDWSPLFDRRVEVRTVTIDGVRLLVEQEADGTLSVGGIRLPEGDTQEPEGKPWDFGILALHIHDTVIDYRSPDLQIKTGIGELALAELATWATQPATLAADGTLNDAGFELDGTLPPLNEGYGFAGRINLSDLPLAGFAALAQPAVTGLDGNLTLDTRLDLRLPHGKPVEVQQEGLVRIDGLHLTQEGNRVAGQRLQWQGTTDITLADDLDLKTRGALNASDLQVELPGEGFNLQQGVLSWDGSVDYAAAATAPLQVTGKVSLEQTRLDPHNTDLRLLGFGSLDIDRVRVDGTDSITIDNLGITDAVFAQALTESAAEEPPPLKITSLDFVNVGVTGGKHISIDSILSDQATYVALRKPDGEWRMTTIIGTLSSLGGEQESTGAQAETAETEPGSIRIGELKNTNATLIVDDQSVRPAFRTRLDMLATTQNLDSARPDQDTHIYVKGHTAKHNSLVIEGDVRPFASPPAMNLESNIEGLELPPLSPYTIAAIGYRLDSGELEAHSTLKLFQGNFDGENRLTMRGLKLAAVKGESLDRMQSRLAVPLDKALDMLRDDNDVIKLKLPITGDIDNPEFDVSDAINQALAKATKEAAISSLTLLLQPYGSLITVARYAADKASQVRLDPVVFAPAATEIDPARHDYLDKVAGIIEKRPNINIKLCGVATAADRAALQEQVAAEQAKDRKKADQEAPVISDAQLLGLADARGSALEDYLVEQRGVNSGRLVACQPGIDTEEDAEPRVDLLI